MPSILLNPYQDLKAVRDPMMFFGRKRLLRRLYGAIAYQQCVSLVGPRHIGKSSILQHLNASEAMQEFGYNLSACILIFIDLREYLDKSVADFFDAVSKQIIVQSRGRCEFIPTSRSGNDEFSAILDQAQEQGVHLVLLMDAFDNILHNKHFDFNFFSFLRSQASVHNISYVIASITPLSNIIHPDLSLRPDLYGSPFFNIFSNETVGPLTLEEARELVMVPAQREGVVPTEDEARWLIELAGRHPFYLQRACYYFFEEKMSQEGGDTGNFRKKVKSQLYRDLLPHFEYVWAHATPEEQEILKSEAQRPGNRVREIPELTESSQFRKFLRRKCQLDLLHMEIEDLKNALDKIHDARFLGESALRHLKLVVMRIDQEDTATAIDRGLAVREVLNEAFEHLRGSGSRTDTAPDWRRYNTLYYRHFKHHMKHELIAVHLAISLRQYYRERDQALEALFQHLFEMEALASKDDE